MKNDVFLVFSRCASCEDLEHLMDTYKRVMRELLDTDVLLITRYVPTHLRIAAHLRDTTATPKAS